MQGFTTIDLIILIVYLGAVLFAGLYFPKREMMETVFQGRWNNPMVGYIGFHLRHLIKPDIVPVPGREFICGNMDYVVCTVRYDCGNPHHYQVFPAHLQQADIDTAYHYLEIRFGSKGNRAFSALLCLSYTR